MMRIIKGGVTFGSKYGATRFTFTRNPNVFAELNNAVCGSNVKWRGKSYAASVPSDLPKPRKDRKRVPKDERQAMLESYVNKYRATHAGKFPTVSDALKEVGGSFYVIRVILQELEYKSKISASNNNVNAGIQSDYMVAINNVETGDTSNKHLKAEGGMQAFPGAEKTLSEEVVEPKILGEDGKDVSQPCLEKSEDRKVEEAQDHHSDFVARASHLLKEVEKVSHQSLEKPGDGIEKEAQGFLSDLSETETHLPKGETKKVDHGEKKEQAVSEEGEKKEQTVSEDLLGSDAPEHKAEQYQGSPELEKYATDISRRHTNDAEPEKKSTLWGNLKSFADGIINIWRKM